MISSKHLDQLVSIQTQENSYSFAGDYKVSPGNLPSIEGSGDDSLLANVLYYKLSSTYEKMIF